MPRGATSWSSWRRARSRSRSRTARARCSCPGGTLPAPRTKDKYWTSIYGLTDAVLLTLDRDGLLEGLGPDVEKIALALDRLWEQEVSAVGAAEVQRSSRTAAPIVAFFSAKGGSGVTTLAINTTAVLARKFPRQVLLADLSAPFGHAALFADLIATGSV